MKKNIMIASLLVVGGQAVYSGDYGTLDTNFGSGSNYADFAARQPQAPSKFVTETTPSIPSIPHQENALWGRKRQGEYNRGPVQIIPRKPLTAAQQEALKVEEKAWIAKQEAQATK